MITKKFKSTETIWHRRCKEYFRDERGAQLEVRIGNHVCDALLPDGTIVEAQRKPLPLKHIIAREHEYQGRLQWIYASFFFLNRINLDLEDEWGLLALNVRFRFRGKIPSIVHHAEPVWIEHRCSFYRLFTWEYQGRYYGKLKERISKYG
jgi:hypothetical protein